MSEPPDEVLDLARERADARKRSDFDRADRLRRRIVDLGWIVVDDPVGGFRLTPGPAVQRRPAAGDLASVLQEPSTFDASVHWIVEGWPEDVVRAIRAFRAHASGRSVQYVIVDLTETDPAVYGDEIEVIRLEHGTGWAAARNAGLRRTLGRTVVVVDGSVEPTGDVLAPLEEALADESVGVCGPFGLITADLRQFEPTEGPECDAIEGYLMAFRSGTLSQVGLFDKRFRWYRTADIELSFRVKAAGLRSVVVPVPVERHEHRMWFNTPPDERARWSKRNFYRFLDLYRDRFDLTVAGSPPRE